HVVLLDLEHRRQLFERQPLDVTQQEQGGVLAIQGGNGASKPLLQEKRRLDKGVRRLIVVDRFPAKLAAAQHVDGRVDGCAPEVGGPQLNVLNGYSSGEDAQEDGLQNVLGIGQIPGDAQGRAEDRLIVALVQLRKVRQRAPGSHLVRQ